MRVSMSVGRVILCMVCVLYLAPMASAQQSWIWARSDHDRPINVTTDSIHVVLLDSRVPSGNNFLAHDTEVGLLMDITFAGSTADQPQARREFPLMFALTTDFMKEPGHPNSKTLSQQDVPIVFFPLTDGKTVYRSMAINIKLLRKQDRNVWVRVFQSLLTATKGMTLPSPLTVGVSYLSTFSNDVLSNYLPSPDNQKRIDLGQLAFVLSSNPSELNRVVRTGLHLRIFPPTGTGPGWVNPSRWAGYCFYTKMEGTNWAVVEAKKDASAPDVDQEGCPQSQYTELMNDYIPILIEAEQKPGVVAKLERKTVSPKEIKDARDREQDMRKAAKAQCEWFGVKKCPVH